MSKPYSLEWWAQRAVDLAKEEAEARQIVSVTATAPLLTAMAAAADQVARLSTMTVAPDKVLEPILAKLDEINEPKGGD